MASREGSEPGPTTRRGAFAAKPVRLAVVIGSVVLAVVGIVLVFTVGRSETSATAVTATLHVPGNPGWITAGDDALWVTLSTKPGVDDRLVRVGLAGGEVQRTAALEGLPSFTIRVDDSLWAVWLEKWPEGPAALVELDWVTGEEKGRVPVGNNARDLVYADGYIWATTGTDGTVLRIDPETREVVDEPIRIGSFALGIAAGEGAVWVSDADAGELVRIDPATLTTTRIAVGGFLAGVAVGGGNVWVSDPDQGLYRVDPSTLQAAAEPIPTASGSFWPASDGRTIWIASGAEGTVLALDVRTGTRLGDPVKIGTGSQNISVTAVTPTSVWAGNFPDRTVSRIDPAAVGAP